MSQTSDRLRDRLSREESLKGVYAATLSDNSSPKEVSVGVTDRRLLCLSDDGSVLNVGYGSICAIRSHPRSTFTYRGNDSRLLLGSGGFLVVLGLAALVALTSSPATFVLALSTVGALATTAFLYATDDLSELATLDDVEQRMAADFEGAAALRRFERELPDHVDGHRLLLAASALVTVACFAGVVALAASPLAILPFVPVAGGGGLIAYARRHADELDGIEFARERARNVRISTDDGRTVRLEIDPSAEIDRELSRLAFVDGAESARTISATS